MRILSFYTINSFARDHLDAATMLEWVEDALAHKHEAILPAKTVVDLDEQLLGCPGSGFYDVMPALIPHLGIAGTKLVDGFPQRSPSVAAQIMVTELATGKLRALVDGTWITAWRTGTVAAHSALLFGNAHPLHGEDARLLHGKNVHPLAGEGDGSTLETDAACSASPARCTEMQRVGIVGLGNTAAACLHVMAAARPERLFEVTVLEYKDQHERFAQRFAGFPNVRVQSVDDMQELMGEKDVVVSAASHFDGDQCEPGWCAPGTTAIPIFKVGFNNLNPVFDLVFVDDLEGIKGWPGGQNIADPVEVAAVVRGKHAGRTSPEQRIVCHNLGIALHDIYWASRLLDLTGCDSAYSDDSSYSDVDKNPDSFSATEVDLGAPATRLWV